MVILTHTTNDTLVSEVGCLLLRVRGKPTNASTNMPAQQIYNHGHHTARNDE